MKGMSVAFAAAHCLNRSSLFGPLMGKVQLHLKVMLNIQYVARPRASSRKRARVCTDDGEMVQDLAPLLHFCR